jgi:hypothetical protein
MRRRVCNGQASHPDLDAARAHARDLRAHGQDVRPYRCRFCHRFHVLTIERAPEAA